MITEKELLKAIRDCERDPVTYNSCEKLANFYVIYDHLFGEKQTFDSPQTEVETVVQTEGDSEFLRAVDGVPSEKAWRVMDELMDAMKSMHPRVYNSVLSKMLD